MDGSDSQLAVMAEAQEARTPSPAGSNAPSSTSNIRFINRQGRQRPMDSRRILVGSMHATPKLSGMHDGRECSIRWKSNEAQQPILRDRMRTGHSITGARYLQELAVGIPFAGAEFETAVQSRSGDLPLESAVGPLRTRSTEGRA